MMTDRIHVTKRQHYVYRKYLKSWADTNTSDPQLSALVKGSKRIFRSGLMGVAQQNYFYEFKVLTEVEKMMAIILSHSRYNVLNHADPYSIIREIEKINTAEKYESSNKNSNYSHQYFTDLRRQLGENMQSKYEEVGQEFINLLLDEDISFYNTDDGRIGFVYFFIMQYIRTKSMRESLNNTFSDLSGDLDRLVGLLDEISKKAHMHDILFDKEKAEKELKDLDSNLDFNNVVPFITYTTVDELVYAFTQKNTMKLYIIKSHPEIKFITGDQPAINIHSPSPNDKKEVDDLEFYYPLSPDIAVILNFPDHQEWPKNLSKQQTMELNKKIYQAAHLQVYATDDNAFKISGII